MAWDDGGRGRPEHGERINIRNLSIKCGNCDTYQTLSGFTRREGWNVYTYESRTGSAIRR